jgi:hypothetical protein
LGLSYYSNAFAYVREKMAWQLSEVEKTLHLNYSARARLSLLKNKISLDSERTSEYENSKFKTSFENEDEETSNAFCPQLRISLKNPEFMTLGS